MNIAQLQAEIAALRKELEVEKNCAAVLVARNDALLEELTQANECIEGLKANAEPDHHWEPSFNEHRACFGD